MSRTTDVHYGRGGGRWQQTRRLNLDRLPLCDVCARPLTCGQPGRHHTCDPEWRARWDARNTEETTP